jgi:DNA polymerase III alpha subunit
MIELFSDIPESIDNTNAIVDKVEVLEFKERHPPTRFPYS